MQNMIFKLVKKKKKTSIINTLKSGIYLQVDDENVYCFYHKFII